MGQRKEEKKIKRIEKQNEEKWKNLVSSIRVPAFESKILEGFRREAENIEKFLKSVERSLGGVSEIQKQILGITESIQKSLPNIEKFAVSTPWIISSFNFNGILDSFSSLKIPDFMEEDEWKKFEYNWLGFLTYHELKEFYKKWKEGNESEVKDYFFAMFDNGEKIGNLLKKLSGNELFDSRMHIIKDALDAHVEGRYSLSIPVIISQIDGIFIDAHKDVLKNDEGKFVDYCECGKPFYISPTALRISKKLLRDNTAETEFISPYLVDFLKFIVDEYGPRSKILHGLSKDYPDRDHSTKLILALYELRQSLGRMEN